MLSIIKSELTYIRPRYPMFLLIFAMLGYKILAVSTAMNLFIVLTVFFVINELNSTRQKEKRDRQHLVLPIPLKTIAQARAHMIAIPCGLLYSILLVVNTWYRAKVVGWNESNAELFMLFGLTLFGFSAQFFLRDFSAGFRNDGMHTGKIVATITFSVVAVLMASGIATVFKRNTLIGEILAIVFLVGNIALLYATIVTFQRRRSYTE